MVERESEKIYSFGYSLIMFSSFIAMFFGIGAYIMFSLSKNDTIIVSIIGFILSSILFFMIKYIINKNPDNDLYEFNKNIFGNIFGTVLNIIIWIGFFLVSLIILYNMADFFNTEYLPETSIDYLKIFVLLPIIYVSTKNISTLIKMNQILSLISVGMIFLDIIGMFNQVEIMNLEPLFTTSKVGFFKSVLTYAVFSMVPFTMLLITGKKNIKDEKRLNGNLLKSFLFSNVIQVIIIVFVILTLGMEYISIFRFPEYIALKNFSLFNILERVENILALQFYFTSFSLLSFLYYFLIRLLPVTKMNRYYSIILALIQYVLTKIIFRNTITFIEIIQKYLVYIIIALILLPIVLVFFRTLTCKRLKNQEQSLDK